LDLMRFARGGAEVTGIELSETALSLARQYFESEGRATTFERMDGEAMSFPDASFDVVYCHGVFPYAVDPAAIAAECRRVLKPGGEAIFMVYNRRGWLAYISKVVKAGLEHDDAPVFRPMSIAEFRRSLAAFQDVKIVPERFPVPTKLHKGLKGFLYNGLFVPGFNLIPRFLVRRLGWHLMAYCRG
ncbi:MAG: class I SAM-dependent methyltransferase, partial [Planctomycetota bacterium]